MRTTTWLAVSMIISMAATPAIKAQSNKTFRTPAAFVGVSQGQDEVTAAPEYDFSRLAGHDLVNLALGTPLDTLRTNEVLALDVECDSSAMSLVVFDKTASSNIATIATSSRIDIVVHQDDDATAFPNRERFVAILDIATLGDSQNGLLGGYLTLAGRLHLNPLDGCPRAVLVDIDRRDDKFCGDPKETKNIEDIDRIKFRAGRAHFIGVLELISLGTTNTVLVPVGGLSINRQLLP